MTIPASRTTAYTGIKQAVPPELWFADRDPTSADWGPYDQGDEWLNQQTHVWWKLCSKQGGVADWQPAAGGVAAVTDFTTDSGSVAPVASNVNVFGVSAQGVSTSGSGNTLSITVANATTASKGVAEFNPADFSVSGGIVSLDAGVPQQFNEDTGSAVPVAGILNIHGDVTSGIGTIGAGGTVVVNAAQAATAQRGTLATASNAVATGFSNTLTAVTPGNLPAVFASPPPLGSVLPNTVEATTVNLSALTGSLEVVGHPFYTHAQIPVTADGNYCIAKGTSVSGIYIVSWTSQTLSQQIVASVRGILSNSVGSINVLSNSSRGSIFSDIYLNQDNTGLAALMVTVAGIGTDTGNIRITLISSFDTPVDGNNNQLAPTFVFGSNVDTFGFNADPVTCIPEAIAITAATTTQPITQRFSHQCFGTAGNNIGSAVAFNHEQADGTSVDGVQLYSQATGAATNVQTTELHIQTNIAGVLADRFFIGSDGNCYGNQFISPLVASVAPSASAVFFGQGAGGASNVYYELDLNGSTGYGGLLIKDRTDGTGAHDWQLHVHRSANSINIENNGVPILTVDSTKALSFDGITSGYTGSQEVTVQAGVQTVDATQTTLYTITLAANEMLTVWAIVNGMRDDFSAAIGGNVTATARKSGGGAAALVGSPIVNSNEDSAGTPSFTADVNGNTIRIRVTGIAAENWNWVATIRYSRLQTNA